MTNHEFDELVNNEKELWDQYRALQGPAQLKLQECRVANRQVEAETYRRKLIQEMITNGELSVPNIKNRDVSMTADYPILTRHF
jgi:hypothetical protein